MLILDLIFSEKKKEKSNWIKKDELGEKIMTKFFGLRAKNYNYLIDGGSENTKARGTKRCVMKRKFKFKNRKSCLEATQLDRPRKNKICVDSL